MDYDNKKLKGNQYISNNKKELLCLSSSSSSSSTSSSSIETSSSTPLNNASLLNMIKNTSAKSSTSSSLSKSQHSEGQNSPYITTNTSTMSSSSSQIFATAASFNISQNDIVFYSRETIHLLAKFLSNNSDNSIFRSLYAFAPDNLAWLWAFFDWDIQIDLEKIDTIDSFAPFNTQDDPTNSLDAEQIKLINKIISDAPLFQYKYRDNIMIGDVFKFIEHVQKIEVIPVARALFVIYFPRFACYIENPLKRFNICPKILKTNLSRIKYVDDIVKSLIKSRYSNLDEYKQKILTGTQLPSYVRNLLNENDFWSEFTSRNSQEIAKNDSKKSSTSSIGSLSDQYNGSDEINSNYDKPDLISIKTDSTCSQNVDILSSRFALTNLRNFDETPNTLESSSNKTYDYMKLLQKSTKINDDLDHISFDNKNKSITFNEDLSDFLEFENAFNETLLKLERNKFGNEIFTNNDNSITKINADVIINKTNNKDGFINDTENSFCDMRQNIASINKAKLENFRNEMKKSNESYLLDKSKNLNDISFQKSGLVHDNMLDQNINDNSISINTINQLTNSFDVDYIGSPKNNNIYGIQSPIIGSPSKSPLQIKRSCNKIVINTPKTPNTLEQYGSYDKNYNSVLWPSCSAEESNNQSENIGQINSSNFLNNNHVTNSYNRNFYSSSTATVTPPPSASSFKQTPLSIITNENTFDLILNDNNNESNYIYNEMASPINNIDSNDFYSEKKNHINLNHFEPLSITSTFNDETLNKYMKHSAFISSPVTRFTNSNKINYSNFNKFSPNLSNRSFNNNYNGGSTSLHGSSNKLSLIKNEYSPFGTEIKNEPHYCSNVDLISPKYTKSYLVNNSTDNVYNNKSYDSPFSPSGKSNVSILLNQSNQSRSQNYINSQNSHHQTWEGRLPPKIYSDESLYSRKVFLGGLPWDVNQQSLVHSLYKYGSVRLEIPGKDAKHPRASTMCKTQERSTPGYVYIIFDNEASVQKMLADCRKEFKNGGEHYFYTILIPTSSNVSLNHSVLNYNSISKNQRTKTKEVEVIPWNQEDTSYVPQNKANSLPPKIDSKSTVFVGALHGMLNAQGLAKLMSEVFGEVIHAGLDTDKYKYPIGSGRVTFRNRFSYVKAIKSKYLTVRANLDVTDPSPKFEKTIQIDPYIEDAKCCKCESKSYYFCRNEYCLDYYCLNCWTFRHDTKANGEHQSISRQNKQTSF